MGRAELSHATGLHLPAGGRGPLAAFCHLRLIHPARNRLPRDFIR